MKKLLENTFKLFLSSKNKLFLLITQNKTIKIIRESVTDETVVNTTVQNIVQYDYIIRCR